MPGAREPWVVTHRAKDRLRHWDLSLEALLPYWEEFYTHWRGRALAEPTNPGHHVDQHGRAYCGSCQQLLLDGGTMRVPPASLPVADALAICRGWRRRPNVLRWWQWLLVGLLLLLYISVACLVLHFLYEGRWGSAISPLGSFLTLYINSPAVYRHFRWGGVYRCPPCDPQPSRWFDWI